MSYVKHGVRPQVTILVDALSKSEYGKVWDFKSLSEIAGMDVRKDNIMQTAVKKLKREHSMVFMSVRGIGYECLKPNQFIADLGSHYKKAEKQNRMAKVTGHAINNRRSELTKDEANVADCFIRKNDLVIHFQRVLKSPELENIHIKAVSPTEMKKLLGI
jgi:hypothetical protein